MRRIAIIRRLVATGRSMKRRDGFKRRSPASGGSLGRALRALAALTSPTPMALCVIPAGAARAGARPRRYRTLASWNGLRERDLRAVAQAVDAVDHDPVARSKAR